MLDFTKEEVTKIIEQAKTDGKILDKVKNNIIITGKSVGGLSSIVYNKNGNKKSNMTDAYLCKVDGKYSAITYEDFFEIAYDLNLMEEEV